MLNVNLVVGLWDTPGDLTKARNRIGGDANVHVVATLADAQAQVRMVAELLLVPTQSCVAPNCAAVESPSPQVAEPIHS